MMQQFLAEDDIYISEATIRETIRKKIPRKLANAATKLRLESEVIRGEKETLECSKCHTVYPKDAFYFARSRDKRTGFCSQCKVCQKESYERRRDKKKAENTNT
jgi:Pyruvate/2-oxoacid:ferredoxin oxidoreductase delta subunit